MISSFDKENLCIKFSCIPSCATIQGKLHGKLKVALKRERYVWFVGGVFNNICFRGWWVWGFGFISFEELCLSTMAS